MIRGILLAVPKQSRRAVPRLNIDDCGAGSEGQACRPLTPKQAHIPDKGPHKHQLPPHNPPRLLSAHQNIPILPIQKHILTRRILPAVPKQTRREVRRAISLVATGLNINDRSAELVLAQKVRLAEMAGRARRCSLRRRLG